MEAQIHIQTDARSELIDITEQVHWHVRGRGVQSGLCMVFLPHTTAGPTLNENWDPTAKADIMMTVDRLVPWQLPGPAEAGYRHSEGNSAAHAKASLMGFSQALLAEHYQLTLGNWEGIYLAEFEGPRERRVPVQFPPESAK